MFALLMCMKKYLLIIACQLIFNTGCLYPGSESFVDGEQINSPQNTDNPNSTDDPNSDLFDSGTGFSPLTATGSPKSIVQHASGAIYVGGDFNQPEFGVF